MWHQPRAKNDDGCTRRSHDKSISPSSHDPVGRIDVALFTFWYEQCHRGLLLFGMYSHERIHRASRTPSAVNIGPACNHSNLEVMSGDHAKKMGIGGEKSATSHGKAPSGESANKVKGSPSHNKSGRSGDKKKKMRKVVYYETDSSSPSTSGSDAPSVTSKRHERKKFSKIPLRYPRISKHTPLLFIPLGKPPMFDGEDYNMWSDKMRHHLTSLHTSIWDVVEIGVQVPSPGDEDYDSDEVAQIRHFNSQATTILLASLSREEYNKVQGLKSAKEIWDVLKTAHEGDEVTKITKRETIEGELGRFRLNQGEDPQAMYNSLKTLVNQVRNLGSTK
jgi:hypothetical protein